MNELSVFYPLMGGVEETQRRHSLMYLSASFGVPIITTYRKLA